MNEIFSITFLYTHQPSHKKIAPRPFRIKAVGRGVFILLVCFAEKSFKSIQIFEQREQSQTLLELCRVARMFAESKSSKSLLFLFDLTFGLLLRTSAIQASLMALGLSSVVALFDFCAPAHSLFYNYFTTLHDIQAFGGRLAGEAAAIEVVPRASLIVHCKLSIIN